MADNTVTTEKSEQSDQSQVHDSGKSDESVDTLCYINEPFCTVLAVPFLYRLFVIPFTNL